MNITVSDILGPVQIVNSVLLLDEHGNTFQAVGEFQGDLFQCDGTDFLEISELGDFHAVNPDFPAQTGGAEGRGFPVVFDKPDIMFFQVDADLFQAFEIYFLGIIRRGLDDDRVLFIMLEAVWVIAVAAVRRPE